MSNATFEQYGYNSAYELMYDLARDILDGGELIAVQEPKGTSIKIKAYKFDGGYWLVTYRRGCLSSIDYFNTLYELLFVMSV